MLDTVRRPDDGRIRSTTQTTVDARSCLIRTLTLTGLRYRGSHRRNPRPFTVRHRVDRPPGIRNPAHRNEARHRQPAVSRLPCLR